MSTDRDETAIAERGDNDNAPRPPQTWQERHGAALIAGSIFLFVALLVVFEMLT